MILLTRKSDEPFFPFKPSCGQGPREQDPHPTPRDVFEALFAKFEIEVENGKRRNKRYPWSTRITVWAREDWGHGTRTKELDAVTWNVSLEGLSFYCERFLRVGTPISIRFDALNDRPVLDGITRSFISLGGTFHCVAIEFVGRGSEPPDARS